MQTKLLRFALPACLCLVAAHAAVQTSDIQGFNRTAASASTDTPVSPSFGRAPVWVGLASGGSGSRITVAGSPGWSSDRFAPGADTYCVRVLGGALSGEFFTVASNDGTSLLVDAMGLDLTSLAPGDRLELAPYWTLGTLYPAAQAGVSFTASASPLVRQTELYFYDPAGSGMNRSPSATYYFYNGAWRKVGSAVTASFDGKVILPDAYFVQRNKAAATTLTQVGRVQPGPLATWLEARSDTKQDNYTAVSYPLGQTLRQLGLAETAAFTTSVSSLARSDELWVFDPAQTGFNRAPSATYYYYDGGWRKVGSSVSTDFSDSVTLPAGGGFIVRRAAGGSTGAWVFDSTL